MKRIGLAAIAATLLALGVAQPALAQLLITTNQVTGPCMVKAPDRGEAPLPAVCAKAIAAAPDKRAKAILYFAWAYSLNEAGNALAALPYLDKAIALAPDFSNALHERSYTLNGLGFYERALADSNAAIKLFPDQVLFYKERAFSYFNLARFEDALADRERVIAASGNAAESLLAKVEVLMWLGRYDEAARMLQRVPKVELGSFGIRLTKELERRQAYRPVGDPAARCTLDALDGSGDAEASRKLVDDCTWAFDHGNVRVMRADYLTVRSVARVIEESRQESGTVDMLMAVAFDPANPHRNFNYGFHLVAISHSWAARNQFDTALASTGLNKQQRALALAGRAQANLNLGERKRASADADASYRLEPNEAALTVQGQIAFDRGEKEKARGFWLKAWRMGSRGDHLRESLSLVGIDDPDKAGGK